MTGPDPSSSTILVTGAAGRIGTLLRHAFAGRHTVRCHDTVAPAYRLAGEEWTHGDVADADRLAAAADGVDSIVHLAADADPEAPWDRLHGPNVAGVRAVYETAVRTGVRSVVFASSHHASGGYDRDRTPGVEATWPPRPCCRYGVTKVFGEALGRHHADVDGLSVTCLRIGEFAGRPTDELSLRIWVSPDDLVRAFRAALTTDQRYGVHLISSANTRSLWRTADSNRQLGYAPRDDAEAYAADVGPGGPRHPCFRRPADPPTTPDGAGRR
ncbi:NAD-dependent epimerase/dehydratase family protein [Polymorphospora rubra]|uniref:NAD-dependent epimerase/dehydratase family protein n=1 Tax=Polymorphospora rubra TaxID=338584 RepID=UPI0033F5A974